MDSFLENPSMTAIPTTTHLQSEFAALLNAAAEAHAGDLHIRLDGDTARVGATVRGQPAAITTWPAERCEAFLSAVFALCDGADSFRYGSARSMRLSGERLELPAKVSGCLVQFLAPVEGGRVLVVRINYQGEACCGSCGG
jgi:hypothetical protein